MEGTVCRGSGIRDRNMPSQGEAATEVAQTSKSAVSRVSKPANGAPSVRPADLEIDDTAGLETCATPSALSRADGAGNGARVCDCLPLVTSSAIAMSNHFVRRAGCPALRQARSPPLHVKRALAKCLKTVNVCEFWTGNASPAPV